MTRELLFIFFAAALFAGCGSKDRPQTNPPPLSVKAGISSTSVPTTDSVVVTIEIHNLTSQPVVLDKLDCRLETPTLPAGHVPVSAKWTMTWLNNEYVTPVFFGSYEDFGLFFYGEELRPHERLKVKIAVTVLGCRQGEQVLLVGNYLQARGYDHAGLPLLVTITCNYDNPMP